LPVGLHASEPATMSRSTQDYVVQETYTTTRQATNGRPIIQTNERQILQSTNGREVVPITGSRYRLTYFNAKGRAETIRLVFAAAGLPYEDRRIDSDQWAAMKSHTPWGSLPLLEEDGNVIGQSVTVARYIAKEGGLGGRDHYEQALIDSAVDRITELRERVIKLAYTPECNEKNMAIKMFEDSECPAIIPSLDKFLARNPNNSGYFVGKQMSLADIHFFSTIELLLPNMPDALIRHPRLQQLYDRVRTHPRIAEYIKRRPQTPI